MPSTYSGVNVYPASYQIPSDGDSRNASSVNAALEALGDRTTYLKNLADQLYAHYIVINAGAASGAPSSSSHAWPIGTNNPVDNLGLTLWSPMLQDDVIEYEWWASLTAASAINATLRLAISEDSTSFTDTGATWLDANAGFSRLPLSLNNTEARMIHLTACHTILAAAPSQVRMVVQCDTLDTVTAFTGWGFRYRIYRVGPL